MRSLPTIRMRGTCQRCPWTVRSCCWSSSSPISWQGHPDLTWPGHLVYQNPDMKKNDYPNLALDDVGRHPISVMKTPCWLVVWNMTFVFHNIWNNPSYWLSYSSRWLLQRQPACATIKIMGISGHNWRSQPGCFTIDQRSLQTPMCFFFHLILLVLSHMSLKKYYLPMILNISSNGGIHRFIIDKLIFSCLCWFDHLCRPFCMQVVTKDDATPSFTAGSLLPSGAVDDIPSSRLT